MNQLSSLPLGEMPLKRYVQPSNGWWLRSLWLER